MMRTVRPLLFIICGVVGYASIRGLTDPVHSPRSSEFTPTAPAPAEPARTTPAPSADTLLAEWKSLRAAHGQDHADMPALYEAAKSDNTFRRRAFRSLIIAEWAASDPQAGLAFLLENDKWMVNQFAREWLRLDPDAAVAGLLANGKSTQATLRAVLSDIARLAPGRLAEVVNALPPAENRWDTSTQNAFTVLAQHDLEAARAAAAAVSGPQRTQALAGLALAWAERDSAAALAWAQGLPAGSERDAVLKSTLIGLARSDPMAALDKIDLVPPGGDEMAFASDVASQVLSEAADANWEQTVQWLEAHPGKLGGQSLNGLMNALSQRLTTDPAGTLQFLAQRPLHDLSPVFGNAVLNDGYARVEDMWKWLEAQPDSPFVNGARSSLLNAMAWKEPPRAFEQLEKLAAANADSPLLQQGVSSLLNGGTQMDEFENFYGQASPTIRALLLESALMFGRDTIGADPQVWVERLDDLPAEKRSRATMGLASSWAATDPEGALGWVNSLPDSPDRQNAVGAVTSSWANTDIFGAAAWIDSLPAGATRDIATGAMVGVAARKEPESAWSWALTIENREQRGPALMTAYRAMAEKDPALARQMAVSSNLSPEELQGLDEVAQKIPTR